MKRQYISLEQIADINNLVLAVYKASKAKKHRRVVQKFHSQFNENIEKLSRDILLHKLPYGRFKVFQIYDPKKRTIHAACFEDRVFHHAVMNIAGERIEKSMVEHSYACRPNKGVHKAIQQVQYNLQRYKWFVKIDISSYFLKVDHQILLQLLSARFKGAEFIKQLKRIVNNCPNMDKKGLPIGSLSSQYFANYYLDGLDRFLASHKKVSASIRYMDDVIWWCNDKQQAKQLLREVRYYLQQERKLEIKPNIQISPSRAGVSYCGFRVTQGIVRLSRRRKMTIKKRRYYWEQQYINGYISSIQLQAAYASIEGISQGTDSLAWKQKQLSDNPSIDV